MEAEARAGREEGVDVVASAVPRAGALLDGVPGKPSAAPREAGRTAGKGARTPAPDPPCTTPPARDRTTVRNFPIPSYQSSERRTAK